ncbi:hypothetical protein B0H19DRAFT_1261041 [Mycena capillaripes]|nr:hypothetical protein B0H19DRAFT_1261041 [Mycena capillaripes]
MSNAALLRTLQIPLNSIVYPVLSLPPEITCEIFIHCLPTKWWTEAVNPKVAPLLLTHICRAWRQIAIFLPALWTTFYIETDDIPAYAAEIMETWFTRAGEGPLFVKIVGELTCMDNFTSFMEAFRRCSPRMQSLELHTALHEIDTHPLDFSQLKQLSLGPFFAPFYFAIEMFSNAPLLEEALMQEVQPSLIALPWHQLTKFTGEIYTPAECLEALLLMPNITECDLAVTLYKRREDSEDSDDEDDLDTFSHPDIEHLTLFEAESEDRPARSSCILTLLTLPALQSLKIVGSDDWNERVLDEFLLRSSPPLRELSIHPHYEQEGGTDIKLSASFVTLNLTHLEVWYPTNTFIFSFFDLLGVDPIFLPELQSLSFLGCRNADNEASPIDIVQTAGVPIADRNLFEGCVKLQSFHVVSESTPGIRTRRVFMFREEDLLPFKQLKASGMDIYIGTEEQSVV